MYLTNVPQLTVQIPMGSEAECEEHREIYVESLSQKNDPRLRYDVACVGTERPKKSDIDLSGMIPWEWRYGKGFFAAAP